MKVRTLCFLVLTVLLLCATTSCFQSAGNDRATSGLRDGVEYCYIKEDKLLLLSGKSIRRDNRIFSLPFAQDVERLYVTGDAESIEKDCFSDLKNLKTVFCASEKETAGYDLQAYPEVLYGVADFENKTFREGRKIGHCIINEAGECLICKNNYRFVYEDFCCYLTLDGHKITGETVNTEGKEIAFDVEGRLIAKGFTDLGGEVRYYSDGGTFVIGTKDLDGVRYTFSADGVLTGEKTLDDTIPVYQILIPIFALLCGAGVCLFVIRFRKYKEKKEDEKER